MKEYDKMMLRSRKQMSETNMLMILLTISGGLQDAYSYFVRGEVFFKCTDGKHCAYEHICRKRQLAQGVALSYTCAGVCNGDFIAERLHARFKDVGFIHWRQIIVFTEMVLLCIVGFIPLGGSYDFVANALSSCACAMQVQSFRKVNSYPYASTMCIGNMRSAMESISAYMRIGDKSLLRKSLQYFLTIFVFACGAGIGGAYSLYIGNEFIWISCALLLICFVLMFIKSENDMMREDM